jgi:molybdopterin molybdotransferase
MIISGGVSVGERDLVQDALREIGAQIDLWRVAVKPGKPFLFGVRERCAIFGLPGNPVSSFVTFLIFVRPALLRMMGAKEFRMPSAFARLAHDVAGDETRPHYVRGKLTGALFSLVGPQESHALFGLARSNALLRVNPGQKLAAGAEVEVLLVNQMAATG